MRLISVGALKKAMIDSEIYTDLVLRDKVKATRGNGRMISSNTIVAIKKGEAITPKMAKDICTALNVEQSELFVTV